MQKSIATFLRLVSALFVVGCIIFYELIKIHWLANWLIGFIQINATQAEFTRRRRDLKTQLSFRRLGPPPD